MFPRIYNLLALATAAAAYRHHGLSGIDSNMGSMVVRRHNYTDINVTTGYHGYAANASTEQNGGSLATADDTRAIGAPASLLLLDVAARTDVFRNRFEDAFTNQAFCCAALVVACMVCSTCIVSAGPPRTPAAGIGYSSGCAMDEIGFTRVVCEDTQVRDLAWSSHVSTLMMTKTVEATGAIEDIPAPWTEASLSEVLTNEGFSTASWKPQAKQCLLGELQAGKARVVRHSDAIVRVVEIVQVVVEFSDRVLLETSRCDNHFEVLPERTPCSRRRAGESVFAAARRMLIEKVEISLDLVRVSERLMSVKDVEEKTDFYRGLPSIVRKFLVKVVVLKKSPEALSAIGLSPENASGILQRGDITYKWMPRDTAVGLSKPKTSKRASGGGAAPTAKFCAKNPIAKLCDSVSQCRFTLEELATPVLPWTERSVLDIFKAHDVPSSHSQFGVSLEELVARLSQGELTLGVRQRDHQLFCVVSNVCLRASALDGFVIVQKDSTRRGRSQYALPMIHILPDESVWSAARRVAHSHFGQTEITEGVFVEEHALDEIEPRGSLRSYQAGHPKSNLLYRAFVVNASIPVASGNFKPAF